MRVVWLLRTPPGHHHHLLSVSCCPAPQILYSVTGEMRPGEMLALMGPSGSGKTSLLSVISGRAAKAVTTSGRITTSGQRFTKAAKRRVGFVLQDDLLYEVRRAWWCWGTGSGSSSSGGVSGSSSSSFWRSSTPD